MRIESLISGGLITNYYCSSACGHCLYRCSPHWEKQYISAEKTEEIASFLRSFGIRSIHIGGGEPLLNMEKLIGAVSILNRAGIDIEYVETNGSWVTDTEGTCERLEQLISSGIRTLLVSISPFHNEYIPFWKTKTLISACNRVGMNLFPWVMDFYQDLEVFDDSVPHKLSEYQERFGPGYVKNIPGRYWIRFGGRSLRTYRDVLPAEPVDRILSNEGPCFELTDTSHFHVDLFGNYVPGLCSGFAIDLPDIGKPLPTSQYPLLDMLYSEGISALYAFATDKFDFKAKDAYLNKCDLCTHIREYLVRDAEADYTELSPSAFYLAENSESGT